MPSQNNPFIRGYQNITVSRTLMITYEDDCPPCYRPIHPTQAHLPDHEVQLFTCIFCDDFALITEGQTISEDHEDQCGSDGIVRTVLYALMADDFGAPIHVGDVYSDEAAREIVIRLTFETGRYSRCWEISTTHLTASAVRYLENRADSKTSFDLLFEAFRIPESHAVGCKLLCTPWTDAHLQKVDGTDAEVRRQVQLLNGVPESLVNVLHLAALADTRILLFDPDAPVLTGLPIYED